MEIAIEDSASKSKGAPAADRLGMKVDVDAVLRDECFVARLQNMRYRYGFDFDLILTLIRLLSHAELLEGFLSLVDLTRGPHVFTVHPVVCSVRTVGKPQTP